MTLTEVYFLIEETKLNAVDLVEPVDGSTHKSTKALLHDVITDAVVGYIIVDIRGAETPDNSRARSCQTNIVLEQLQINLLHGSTGIFSGCKKLNEPSQIVALDFNGRNTSISIIQTEDKYFFSLIQ